MNNKSPFRSSAFFKRFFSLQSASGLVLLAATVMALLMANSPLAQLYEDFTHLAHVPVNDGLMVIFFFLVGLEIKREVVAGALSNRAAAFLPLAAALGGMIVPALIFVAINFHHPLHLKGWAIPTATDIAFALGILALLGRRIPASIRVFLLAIAVIDDLGAIIIIALFYSGNLSLAAGCGAAIVTGLLYMMKIRNVRMLWPYLVAGAALAGFLHAAGIHTTIAGVITALFIPLPLLEKTEHGLNPYVSFGIMPLFAFTNAGLSLQGFSLTALADPLPLGIIAGLLLGKQIGIFGASFCAVKSGLSPMPQGATFGAIYGMALLCGIGFTISLFIGMLAFTDQRLLHETQLGVMTASLLSSVAGYLFLRFYKGTK